MGENVQNIYIYILRAFKISHVFLPDISVHYALTKYIYICLRVYS
jgi:hypothetical protein